MFKADCEETAKDQETKLDVRTDCQEGKKSQSERQKSRKKLKLNFKELVKEMRTQEKCGKFPQKVHF